MKKHFSLLSLCTIPLLLCSCQTAEKTTDLTVIYIVTAVLSALILAFYCFSIKKKNAWFLLLFSCVLIVNFGYLALSLSRNLEEALLANRLAYLGSVFLPISMLMIIIGVTNTKLPRALPAALITIGVIMFLIAASQGYLGIYYKEVTFEKLNGVTVLNKVYGPLHVTYLIYLMGCFAAMVAVIVRATLKETIASPSYAAILAVAVFVNLVVWMIEQIVRIDFEILSVSYIISETFLLGLKLFMVETEKEKQRLLAAITDTQIKEQPVVPEPPDTAAEIPSAEELEAYLVSMATLTPKERSIYNCYVSGDSTKEIMLKLCITENTLKFHNKNLYGKLGVSSRKQLIELHRTMMHQKKA